MKRGYRAKTLSGATRRVRELEDQLRRFDDLARRYRLERNLMARLAADTPQFDNPLGVYEAKKLRDQILKEIGAS